jgi:hypothetical protein
MAINSIGADVFPEILIVPLFNFLAIACMLYLLGNVREPATNIRLRLTVSKNEPGLIVRDNYSKVSVD